MEFIGVGWISLGNDPMASKVYANSIESVYRRLGRARLQHGSFGAFWSIWDVRSKEGLGAWTQLNWTRKGRRGSHLEDQLDHLLDHPVKFLNSTSQDQLDRAEKSKSNPKNVAFPLTFL
ncbi:unnamed protein product [Microthlaspi erraticum]|uniref:Uncharacterized protein n=1 Tax=Microthlaspi erraticum TaxID=1685480 RepID=A0A6D2HUP5_9BRAS|nr:unnamed protein product [Microthlaspi erraticum]